MMPRYTDADIVEEAGEFCLRTELGTMRGKDRHSLLKMANSMAEAKLRPARFFEAWQFAVMLAGKQFFTLSAGDINAATDKNQLRPDWEAITRHLVGQGGDDLIFLESANSQDADAELRSVLFQEAWQDAVALAGERFFSLSAGSIEASPQWEVITRSLGVLSSGERRFLIALCQFCDDAIIGEYCAAEDIETPSLSDLARMDQEHVEVLCRLMRSYSDTAPVVSGDSEHQFLIALYQFYNDTDIIQFCRDAGIQRPSLADLARLERGRVDVLCRLLQNYAGW